MKYVIKTYREEYLDDHARIEANEKNRWEIIVRPDKEQLKTELAKKYSQPDFDPSTRLYCFQGDSLVGFLTAKIMKEVEICGSKSGREVDKSRLFHTFY